MPDLCSLEALRAELHTAIDISINARIAELNGEGGSPTVSPPIYKTPTLADGHDPRNKNGLNLTPRGVEILYRVFDDDGGYNRAAKMLNISQGAAKNRKALWVREGGKNRTKQTLDIDGA
jgi:hypothetical protein